MYFFNIQLFAEGAGGGAPAASGEGNAAGGSMAMGSDAGSTENNKASETPVDNGAEDLDAEYEELMKSKFKKQRDRDFNRSFKPRFKELSDKADSYKAALDKNAPLIAALKERYGTDDPDELLRAVDGDEYYIREEANKLGMEVPEYLRYRDDKRTRDALEEENAAYKREKAAREERNAFEERVRGWMNEANALKTQFPELNFAKEAENETFVDLLNRGLPVEQAYKIIHHDDIVASAMHVAAQRAAEGAARSVAQQQARPSENGLHGQAGAATKVDVNSMTGADIIRLAEESIRSGRSVKLT